MTSRILIPLVTFLSLLLAGCGGISMGNLNPFGGGPEELSRVPLNATAYQCDAGKRLYVRYMDGGAYAWVILPEREFRLDRAGPASGTRYGTGSAILDRNGDEVTLSDGPAVSYLGCKVAAAAPAKVSQETKEKGDKKK